MLVAFIAFVIATINFSDRRMASLCFAYAYIMFVFNLFVPAPINISWYYMCIVAECFIIFSAFIFNTRASYMLIMSSAFAAMVNLISIHEYPTSYHLFYKIYPYFIGSIEYYQVFILLAFSKPILKFYKTKKA